MKSCNCYALRAIDCTCLPEKFDEIYTTPDQEPVAWMDRHFTCDLYKNKPDLDVLPLYTHPQPKQEQGEPVAWVCYGSGEKHDIDFNEDDVNALPVGTMLYATPQQRTWVGLSDKQFAEACRLAENGNYLVAFQRIQHWIKENNK